MLSIFSEFGRESRSLARLSFVEVNTDGMNCVAAIAHFALENGDRLSRPNFLPSKIDPACRQNYLKEGWRSRVTWSHTDNKTVLKHKKAKYAFVAINLAKICPLFIPGSNHSTRPKDGG
jgi:hypothetical protein